MTPRARIRRRRSSAQGAAGGAASALGALLTVALLACILVTGPFVPEGDRSWAGLSLLAMAAVLFVVQGLRMLRKMPLGGDRRLDAIDGVVLAFVGYAVVRWLTSPAEYVSRLEILNVVACAGIFFTCRYGMENRRLCMVLFYLLVAVGVAETIFGYDREDVLRWFPFLAQQASSLGENPRWVGTFASPNHYACFLVLAAGAALALGSFSKLAWPLRILLVYAALMMIVGVIWSGSRGGWLALAASLSGMVTMGVRNSTLRWWWPAGGGLVVAAIATCFFLMSPVMSERMAQTADFFGHGATESDPRVGITRGALRMVGDHPFFGTGPGTFAQVYPRYQDVRFDFEPERTHDDYLNTLDDYGLAGLALALGFLVLVSRKFFTPLMLDHRWQDRVMVAAGFAAWAALLVHSFVDYNLHVAANALLFFALVGLALGRFAEERRMSLSLSRLGPATGWAVVVVSVVLGFFAARAAEGEFAFASTFDRSKTVPLNESIAGADEALRCEPSNPFALIFRGDLLRFRGMLEAKENDRLADGLAALEDYQRAQRVDSIDDEVQVRLGLALDLLRKYPEAVSYYETAVQREPENGKFWEFLSLHYAASGDAKEAAEVREKAHKVPYGPQDILEVDQDIHELPGAEPVQLVVPAPEPAAVPAPKSVAVTPSPAPDQPPPEVIYIPGPNGATTPEPQVPPPASESSTSTPATDASAAGLPPEPAAGN